MEEEKEDDKSNILQWQANSVLSRLTGNKSALKKKTTNNRETNVELANFSMHQNSNHIKKDRCSKTLEKSV